MHPYVFHYLVSSALTGNPALIENALKDLKAEEVDFRPDPERFTIREIMCHLADWEVVFLERMQRICAEEVPLLPNLDEGQMVIDNDYAHQDTVEQIRLFVERRAKMVAFLNGRSAEDWLRVGNRPEIGMISLHELANIVALHDIYHLQQIVQWRQS